MHQVYEWSTGGKMPDIRICEQGEFSHQHTLVQTHERRQSGTHTTLI